jgi:hypothetical protein
MLRSSVVISFVLVSSLAEAAPAAKDPKIVALAGAAAKCKFEEQYFDEECKAYKAWTENDKLFEEGKGNVTILAMFEDADVKMRVLASDKGFDGGETFFADKTNLARFIAAAKKETHPQVARSFASYISRSDIEKVGLGDELKALAKHPLAEFRASLGFNLYASKQSPLRLEVTKMLLADADPKVPADALKGLSMGANRGKAPEACKLMGEQISRPDGDALWQVGTSGCTTVFDALATELVKRSAAPDVAAKQGVGLSLAIGAMCRDGNAAQKTKGFTAAKSLSDAKVKNPNARTASMSAAVACDKAAAKTLLTTLSKDSDKFVAERATKELTNLK